jgi:hypothetical protein
MENVIINPFPDEGDSFVLAILILRKNGASDCTAFE